MNPLALEIEKELAFIEPEDALHLENAVREMLMLARRKRIRDLDSSVQQPKASLPSLDMGGFMPGIDPHKLGQLPDDF